MATASLSDNESHVESHVRGQQAEHEGGERCDQAHPQDDDIR